MAGKLRKFKVHGAYKRKSDAKEKERSAECGGRCFIIPRKIGKFLRHVVLERR